MLTAQFISVGFRSAKPGNVQTFIGTPGKRLGRRIRTIRKQKKMTQQELAELLFLSEESVSNFETGKTMCMPEHVIQMCQIFDVSADYFYFGKNYKLQGNDGIERIFQVQCINAG